MRELNFGDEAEKLEDTYHKLEGPLTTVLQTLNHVENGGLREAACFAVLDNLVWLMEIRNPDRIAILEIIKHTYLKEYEG